MKVFWAWQSDTDQRIGRYLVRDALDAAIQKLKEANEVAEPAEETRLQGLHLDYDTKDLSGSPDIVAAIFDKIAVSAVFIGDVTPVGKTSAKVIGGKRQKAKPLMNPNVSVELGYAIGKIGLPKVLMVFNTAFGNPQELPFDLRSKRGPVTYHLANSDDPDAVRAAKADLTNKLAIVLKPFVATPIREVRVFEETKTTMTRGTFFTPSEKLGTPPRLNFSFSMPFNSHIYLRLIPTTELTMPIALQTLKENVGRYGAFGDQSGVFVLENQHGYAVFGRPETQPTQTTSSNIFATGRSGPSMLISFAKERGAMKNGCSLFHWGKLASMG